MASSDVVSCFTNIPTYLAVDAAFCRLSMDDNKSKRTILCAEHNLSSAPLPGCYLPLLPRIVLLTNVWHIDGVISFGYSGRIEDGKD